VNDSIRRRRELREVDGTEIDAPTPVAPHPMLALQASAGNAAVTRVVANRQRVARFQPPADAARAQEQFRLATEQHRAQSQILTEWLAEGRASDDDTLKNACDWVMAGNSRLYAVSPTGDSDERVTHLGQNPTQKRAYFPQVSNAAEDGDIIRPRGGDYNWRDLDDQSHVKVTTVNTGGWNTSTAIPTAIAVAGIPTATGFMGLFTNVTTGSVSKEGFYSTLKHEVQHAADRSQDKFDRIAGQIDASTSAVKIERILRNRQPLDANVVGLLPAPVQTAVQNIHAARMNGTPFDNADVQIFQTHLATSAVHVRQLASLANLELYKTEFRAYSYQGTYLSFDNRANYDEYVPNQFRVAGRPWTERQYRVFRQIYLGYAHTQDGWNQNEPVYGTGQRFRDAVLRYRDPDSEGVNKLDSPRINTFYDRLLAVPTITANPNIQAVQDLDAAGLTLTPVEATYVRNAAGARRELTREMRARLQGQALERIYAGLDIRVNA
jgi:hypothetical protein